MRIPKRLSGLVVTGLAIFAFCRPVAAETVNYSYTFSGLSIMDGARLGFTDVPAGELISGTFTFGNDYYWTLPGDPSRFAYDVGTSTGSTTEVNGVNFGAYYYPLHPANVYQTKAAGADYIRISSYFRNVSYGGELLTGYTMIDLYGTGAASLFSTPTDETIGPLNLAGFTSGAGLIVADDKSGGQYHLDFNINGLEAAAPEPGTILLAGSALFALALLRLRRKGPRPTAG